MQANTQTTPSQTHTSEQHALLILKHYERPQLTVEHPIYQALLWEGHEANTTSRIIWHVVYVLPPLMAYAYRPDDSYYEDKQTGVMVCRHAARLLEAPMENLELSHASITSLVSRYRKQYELTRVIGHRSLSRYVATKAAAVMHRVKGRLYAVSQRKLQKKVFKKTMIQEITS